ncbi:RNA recognition motif containing protein [Nitzschia inconspicua]|uniref:RNA recognition motif containing protein n=1 Tax=Nitzschia inconspicua TaxID=303405 RepID=A0A9K3KM83_9STRA|nr:RNA recognition motif containing protein [Nitzschia inconspicua]
MSVIERVRASGKYPPSLLQSSVNGDDEFEAAVMKILDANELCLSTGPAVAEDFKSVLQMASGLDCVAGEDVANKKAILVSRRCLILALVGSTPVDSSSLGTILQNGYLSSVRTWMDEILSGSVGGVDLLLHLLTSIAQLPVTKSIVKESGMGKAIGSVEKNRICSGTLNELPIKERVSTIKDAWNQSVKARKEKPSARELLDTRGPLKRAPENSAPVSAPIAKKTKVEDSKKPSSLSTLMKKMVPTNQPPSMSLAEQIKTSGVTDAPKKAPAQKKQKKRVKWKDHFGGNLTAAKILEDTETSEPEESGAAASVSWSDRRKRDRLREKELLAKAKKAKLTDDDDSSMATDVPVQSNIQPTISWHSPIHLPERTDAPAPHDNSRERVTQTTRMASVTPASYASEYSIPSNPSPLSDVEQALDMTSQSSTVTQTMPFFVPQAQVPVPPAAPQAPQVSAGLGGSLFSPPQSHLPNGAASAELVQSLGLPMFLVGQNVEALQTLAKTPSLLSTFVDNHGMYDQVRLISLVQTLSQGVTGNQQPPISSIDHSTFGTYNLNSTAGTYGPASAPSGVGGGYRGAQNNGEGNLHLSGYGPSTTQSEIIALFSPYVIVDEVVMKTTFCFVNTSDPVGAARAREALNGALLGGQPVRINSAQRKNRDVSAGAEFYSKAAPLAAGSYYGGHHPSVTAGFNAAPASAAVSAGFGNPPPPPLSIPGQTLQAVTGNHHGDFSNVRDDRGNPATKNLFVAGYGQGTNETLLRQVFSPHCEIVGIIVKGTFSFINTADKVQAITAREVLSGTLLNGGVLRINFAKESGRLGTSFDLTYGNKAQQPRSHHYGPRGY